MAERGGGDVEWVGIDGLPFRDDFGREGNYGGEGGEKLLSDAELDDEIDTRLQDIRTKDTARIKAEGVGAWEGYIFFVFSKLERET